MTILWCLVLVVTLKEGLSHTRHSTKVDVNTLTKRSSPTYEEDSHTKVTKDVSEEENPPSDEMTLMYLKKSSVTCNDGSTSGYYLRENKKGRRWLIFLEGGWFCFDKISCDQRNRASNFRMSSTKWPPTKKGTGILSVIQEENPHWWTANIVFVPYCSSDLWIGTKTVGETDDYAFTGSLIIEEVINDLGAHGIKQAKVVMLAGSGAGGTGVLMNIDRVAAILMDMGADAAEVRGLVDSAWFLDLKPYSEEACKNAFLCSPLEAIKKGLRSDIATLVFYESYILLNPPHSTALAVNAFIICNVIPKKFPVFVVQYLFDWRQLMAQHVISLHIGYNHLNDEEMTYMQTVGRTLKNSLEKAQAVFAPSCLAYKLITNSDWQDLKIEGFSLADALRCWEKNLEGENENVQACPFHLIEDCQWPQCNSECPSVIHPLSNLKFDLWKLLVELGFHVENKSWN